MAFNNLLSSGSDCNRVNPLLALQRSAAQAKHESARHTVAVQKPQVPQMHHEAWAREFALNQAFSPYGPIQIPSSDAPQLASTIVVPGSTQRMPFGMDYSQCSAQRYGHDLHSQQESHRVVEGKSMESDEDLEAARRMVEILRSSGNARFEDSEFVAFMDKVAKGELKVRDNKVVDAQGSEVSWENLSKLVGGRNALVHDLIDPADASLPIDDLDTEEPPEVMMERIWKEIRDDMSWSDMLSSGTIERVNQHLAPHLSAEYRFSTGSNPYLGLDSAFESGISLMKAGNDSEAIRAYEAVVRKEPDNSVAWTQLGKLHAVFDRDVDAIVCLRKAHEADPYDLDALMSLGVSLTNEFDTLRAMAMIREWMSCHPKFRALVAAQVKSIDPTDVWALSGDFDALKRQVTSLIEQALVVAKDNVELLTVAGVMFNVARDYQKALECFARAAELSPEDASAWNRLGATLANSGRSQEALGVYSVALGRKPLYPRVWANAAVAQASCGDYAAATKSTLAALEYSTTADHLWTSLFMNLAQWLPDRTELGDLVEKRDLSKVRAALGIPRESPVLPTQSKGPSEILAAIRTASPVVGA